MPLLVALSPVNTLTSKSVTALLVIPCMKRQNDRILKEELPRSVGAQYATGDQWRNNSRKNERMEPKQNQYSAVDVTGNRSKVRCCKEQYCIGTWNVRSMNPGKLELVKQEVARVNINILGISELKWTAIGEFNSDDYYIYCCGQESLIRNGVAIMVNKRVQNAVLGYYFKRDRMISVCFQGTPFNIMVIKSMPRPVMQKKLKLKGSMKT